MRSNGLQANGDSFEHAALSGTGRYVVFSSDATNLVSSDTNAVTDVFVHDTGTGSTWRVSVASNGAQGDGESELGGGGSAALVGLSGGRWVLFSSRTTNLIGSDTNAVADVF